jgi:hypothetical protein
VVLPNGDLEGIIIPDLELHEGVKREGVKWQ